MISPELLQNLRPFTGLSRRELRRVASVSKELHYERDQVIFKENTEAENFYLLLEGKVALRFGLGIHPKSREVTIDVVEPGEIIGWSALVPPQQLMTSGISLEPVRILAIAGRDMRKLLDSDRRLGYAVMSNLAEVISTHLWNTRLRLMLEISQSEELSGG